MSKTRRLHAQPRLDFVGAFLSAAGLALVVYGVLRSSEWGWVVPKEGGASWFGLSPTIWLIIAGSLVLWLFFRWQSRLERQGKEPLVETALFGNHQLTGGLAGLLLSVPCCRRASSSSSRCFSRSFSGCRPSETGVRILPLSAGLLITAIGVPKLRPNASPRRVTRVGLLLILAGILALMAGIDLDANAAVVSVPMLLVGLGIGSLASQLGAVTVSAVPDEKSPEVGGLQNTATNLGASFGTALAGSVMIAVLTASLLAGVQSNPNVPQDVKSKASTELAAGVPFISDAALKQAMTDAGQSAEVTQAVVDENAKARIDGLHAALGVLALLACVALFTTGRIPREPIVASVAATATPVQAQGP